MESIKDQVIKHIGFDPYNEEESLKEIKDNPYCCYCYDLVGLYSDIDDNNPIGETEPVDGYPFPTSIGFTQKIYICKRCGKEATLPIAVAFA